MSQHPLYAAQRVRAARDNREEPRWRDPPRVQPVAGCWESRPVRLHSVNCFRGAVLLPVALQVVGTLQVRMYRHGEASPPRRYRSDTIDHQPEIVNSSI